MCFHPFSIFSISDSALLANAIDELVVATGCTCKIWHKTQQQINYGLCPFNNSSSYPCVIAVKIEKILFLFELVGSKVILNEKLFAVNYKNVKILRYSLFDDCCSWHLLVEWKI